MDRTVNIDGRNPSQISGQPLENGAMRLPAPQGAVSKELGVLLVIGGIGGLLLPWPGWFAIFLTETSGTYCAPKGSCSGNERAIALGVLESPAV